MTSLSRLFVLLGLSALGLAIDLRGKISRISENDKVALKIARCTEVVAKALFEPLNDIAIVASDQSHNPELVSKILLKSFPNRIVRVSTNLIDTNDETYINERDVSTIIIGNRANLREMLEDRKTVESWSEFIVVTEASSKWFKAFSRVLWYRGYAKVAFIGINANGTSNVFAFVQKSKGTTPYLQSYDICKNVSSSRTMPESKKNHRDDSMNLLSFSSWAYIPKNSTFTYAKIFERFNDPDEGRTRPNAIIANNDSLGIDLIRIFAAKHNFNLREYVWDKESKVTWADAMTQCVKGGFDIFYTSRLLPDNSEFNDNVSAVGWFRFESVILFDTVKTMALPMTSLLVPFKSSVWLCSLGVSIFFALFAWITVKLSRRGLMRERITILDLWAISVNQSMLSPPAKFGLRFVLGMWLVYMVIFNGCYTSAFSTSIIAGTHDYRLKTFKDVLYSGKSICGGEKGRELLSHENHSVILEIHNRFKVMGSSAVFDAVINKSCIGSRRLSHVRKYNWKHRDDYSRQFYTVNDDVVATYPVFYYAKKRHPFSREFNRIISIARDSGIIEKLRKKYTGWLFEHPAPNHSNFPDDKAVLNMTHLRAAFELLLVGHFVSGIVLVIEIILHKISMKRTGRM